MWKHENSIKNLKPTVNAIASPKYPQAPLLSTFPLTKTDLPERYNKIPLMFACRRPKLTEGRKQGRLKQTPDSGLSGYYALKL